MKFTLATIAAALIGSALATPSPVVNEVSKVKRDVATISSAISAVNSASESLESAVSSYNGGSPDALVSAAANVLSVTKSGTSAISGTSDITANDAITLQPLIATLTTTVNTTISGLISKKSMLDAAGAGAATESALQAQSSAASDFSMAITSKVPQSLQGIAGQLSAPIAASLQDGVNAFMGDTSSGSGSSSSSMSSGGSSMSATMSSASMTATMSSASMSASASSSVMPSTGDAIAYSANFMAAGAIAAAAAIVL